MLSRAACPAGSAVLLPPFADVVSGPAGFRMGSGEMVVSLDVGLAPDFRATADRCREDLPPLRLEADLLLGLPAPGEADAGAE